MTCLNKTKSNDRYKGFGYQIPPQDKHVEMYFIQNGRSEKEAKEFIDHYRSLSWIGKKGQKIGDWKMYAWHWIINS